MIRTLRAAAGADLVETSMVLARAFHDDPIMNWMVPDNEDRQRRLPRFFRATIRYACARVEAELLTEDDRVLGAALWAPPNKWKATTLGGLRSLPAYVWALGPRSKAGAQIVEAMQKHHPPEPHWYLALIGTEPFAQGSGVGSELINTQLARCDQAGEPVYLEASKEANVPYYQKFGFKVISEIKLPDGPSEWGMWRAAR